MKIYPLSVGMTPAFYDETHALLRAQLNCLSKQICKDFDVWLIDPHYSKRKNLVPEWAEHYKLNLVHVPYKPNTHIAKKLDCSVFNAVYCYSQAPRIVRYSCYRFVRPNWTDVMMKCDKNLNMDFDFFNVAPPSPEVAHPQTDHNTLVWNFDSDEVHWDAIPSRSGLPGAMWSPYSDVERPKGPVPKNCYGNIMWWRKNWLDLNGTDEVFTNAEHFEDINFCLRAINAGQEAIRKSHLIYRLHHWYGGHSGRANAPVDHEFKKPCAACEAAVLMPAPTRYDIKNRVDKDEIELFSEENIWVCKTCFLSCSIWHQDCGEFNNHVVQNNITQATVIPKYKIGRNLRILTEDMDKVGLEEKVRIYNEESWINDRYYEKA